MGDIVKPVAQWISQNIPWTILIVAFIVSLFFEISKIKVYPLRWLWKFISWPFRKIDEQRTESFKSLIESLKTDIDAKLTDMSTASNANCAAVKECFVDLEKRFDKLDEQQQITEERLDKLAAARIKNHVLNFARQCRKGEPHSREDFRNLFEECKLYESLVEKYQKRDEVHKKEWENNVFVHDFAYIEHVYDECNIKNNFLGD
jgi:hypothetical protein